MAGNEPPIDGTGQMTGGGGFRRPRRPPHRRRLARCQGHHRRCPQADLRVQRAAERPQEGPRELAAINSAAAHRRRAGWAVSARARRRVPPERHRAAGGGWSVAPATSPPARRGPAGGVAWTMAVASSSRPAGSTTAAAAIAASPAPLTTGLNVIEDRFQRNVAQSIPISSRDAFTASMYTALYKGLEPGRYRRRGAVRRVPREPADGPADRPRVRLDGGQGSQQFLAAGRGQRPGHRRHDEHRPGGGPGRALRLSDGLQPGPGDGHHDLQGATASCNNPMQVGLEYVKDYEKRNNVTMNEIDFANLRNAGVAAPDADEADLRALRRGHRHGHRRRHAEHAVPQHGRRAPDQLRQRRGPQAGSGSTRTSSGCRRPVCTTTGQRREARFFGNQEGADGRPAAPGEHDPGGALRHRGRLQRPARPDARVRAGPQAAHDGSEAPRRRH